MSTQPIIILFAEDDDDDFLLAQDAFAEYHLRNDIRRVDDGEALLDYLLHRGAFADPAAAPRPSLILLDLNMPKMDGREALALIKSYPHLATIPVIALTTSRVEEDILRTYQLGVASYIRKPVTFEQLCDIVRVISQYWFEIVELPPPSSEREGGCHDASPARIVDRR